MSKLIYSENDNQLMAIYMKDKEPFELLQSFYDFSDGPVRRIHVNKTWEGTDSQFNICVFKVKPKQHGNL